MKQVKLKDGLKIGTRHYTRAMLRPLTVGDMLAVEEQGGGEYRRAIETLGRQIVHLETETGEQLPGPLALSVMKVFTSRDITPLSLASEEVERGEADADTEGAARVGVSDQPAHRVVLS